MECDGMTICTNHSHPKVYSTKREIYFCPFCKKKASTPYNVAKEKGITLYEYQEEILQTDGHRVMASARQVGKTTTAMLETAQRSYEGKTLHISHPGGTDNEFNKFIAKENIMMSDSVGRIHLDNYNHLVIDEPQYIKGEKELFKYTSWILDNFETSLIVGTPSMDKYQFMKRVFEDVRFESWQIPMAECPGIPPTDEGLMRQDLNPEQEKREVDAEFV